MDQLPESQRNVVLAPFTTYKIGGRADYFIAVKSREALASAIKNARDANMPYLVLGTGANILIGDRGFRGLVIHNQADNFHFSDNMLTAESGAVMENLIRAAASRGLSGIEHYAGIPSTVGGALWQNLHFLAPDRKSTLFIEGVLRSAEILDKNNQIQTVQKDYFEFGYDDSILHHKKVAVLEATFQLTTLDPNVIQERIRANLAWRIAKHPDWQKLPSCGSVFKRIENVGAGRLIEQAGLKGMRIGDAEVSVIHANFIVNHGHAKASEVRQLITTIQNKVKEKTGYRLELEISFIGEF